jgi:uncharacterized protein
MNTRNTQHPHPLERKFFPAAQLKFLAGDTGAIAHTFSGYASTFGGPPDAYGDIILPGAYDDALKAALPFMYLDHDYSPLPVGKWVEMSVDEIGLKVTGELTPGLSVAQDIYASLKHQTILGLSIGYYLLRDDFDVDEETGIRTIKRISYLHEISLVTRGANIFAQIDPSSIKSAERMALLEQCSTIRELENWLRGVGVSTHQSKAFLSHSQSVLLKEKGASRDGAQLTQEQERKALALLLAATHRLSGKPL